MNKIRVLGIAPYEALENQLQKQAPYYPEIDLTTVYGDLQNGVEMAKKNFNSDFDIILSRGGTANLLREMVTLPVVDIPVTYFDILRAIQLSNIVIGKKAIIGFNNITRNATQLCNLMQMNIDVFTINSAEETNPLMKRLKKEGYACVMCDNIASVIARQLGITAFLITSGQESIDEAFKDIIVTYGQMENLRKENQFLRTVISHQKGDTVIFTNDGHVYYSSLNDKKSSKLIEALKEMIPDAIGGMQQHFKTIDGRLYSINAKVLKMANNNFVAFFFTSSKAPLLSSHTGITIYNKGQIEEQFNNSFYNITGDIENHRNAITQLNKNSRPIMLTGEAGTGKKQITYAIYTSSSFKNQPLIEINCELISSKSWNYLFNSHNSPLYSSNNTIHFYNIDSLSDDNIDELMALMTYTKIQQNNRIIFSCNENNDTISDKAAVIMDKFSCLTIHLSPLRKRPETIPWLVNLYINYLNNELGTEIIRIDLEAVSYLQKYPWYGNYNQFRRIISQLVVNSKGSVIHLSEVMDVLSKEKADSKDTYGIDLNRPLQDIEFDIIQKVMLQNDNNQAATARQLGISRSTLWRLYKK